MSNFLIFFLSLLFLQLTAATATNPTITLGIHPINELSIENKAPLSLLQNSKHTPIETYSAYAITTNGDAKKIIGSIDGELIENAILKITLEAPKGAISLGQRTLSKEDTILVSNISRIAQNNLHITYSMSSSSNILSGSYAKTVKLTLVD